MWAFIPPAALHSVRSGRRRERMVGRGKAEGAGIQLQGPVSSKRSHGLQGGCILLPDLPKSLTRLVKHSQHFQIIFMIVSPNRLPAKKGWTNPIPSSQFGCNSTFFSAPCEDELGQWFCDLLIRVLGGKWELSSALWPWPRWSYVTVPSFCVLTIKMDTLMAALPTSQGGCKDAMKE